MSLKTTTTLRVKKDTSVTIKELAKDLGLNTAKFIDILVDDFQRRQFFQQMCTAYDGLRRDPIAMKADTSHAKAVDALSMEVFEDLADEAASEGTNMEASRR